MKDILKFSLLFVICAVLLTLITGFATPIFDSFGASLNYITTGSVGSVLESIVGFIGWFLDFLFIGTETTYTTYYGGIEVYSLSWVITFVRVVFGLSVLILILKLIIDRGE